MRAIWKLNNLLILLKTFINFIPAVFTNHTDSSHRTGLWRTTETEGVKKSENRDLFVRMTLKELMLYVVYLLTLCLSKHFLNLFRGTKEIFKFKDFAKICESNANVSHFFLCVLRPGKEMKIYKRFQSPKEVNLPGL